MTPRQHPSPSPRFSALGTRLFCMDERMAVGCMVLTFHLHVSFGLVASEVWSLLVCLIWPRRQMSPVFSHFNTSSFLPTRGSVQWASHLSGLCYHANCKWIVWHNNFNGTISKDLYFCQTGQANTRQVADCSITHAHQFVCSHARVLSLSMPLPLCL